MRVTGGAEAVEFTSAEPINHTLWGAARLPRRFCRRQLKFPWMLSTGSEQCYRGCSEFSLNAVSCRERLCPSFGGWRGTLGDGRWQRKT